MYITITCVAHDMPVESLTRDDLNIGHLDMVEDTQYDAEQEITEIRYVLNADGLRCPSELTPEIDQHDFVVKVYDDDSNWLADGDLSNR